MRFAQINFAARLFTSILSLPLLAGTAYTQSVPTMYFGTATTCKNDQYKYDWYVWLQSRDPCLDWRDLGPTALRSPCGKSFGWEAIGHFILTDCNAGDILPQGIIWVEKGVTGKCVPDTKPPERSCGAPWCGGGQVVNVTTLQSCAGQI
ncbi:hypothetical protein PAAG_08858 [Paracoccidioides lutzii Pb01]|uniref:Uncharacterized protein n=1 Tax=Paracoccidioides lutzii (strain ATCC MYA-826 / Pb01) TaxID=502779 RepID=C1HDL7_PARBA|nr:hypothetical protein PAAG_08858 [Paracoccidioides lutzii Pb01]EEH39589.2 hypothetical protein PAAG_08858 [Paracoccidioides lutzii Pb01]